MFHHIRDRLTTFFLLASLLFLTGAALAAPAGNHEPDALMLRFPDVSRDSIVFVYAGDLWVVPRTGGIARRLSSPPGHEFFPKFSPDGRWIAFTGNYDGNTDVYLMPARGGRPRRLTYHPMADYIVEWYPDGRHLLFRSQRMSPRNRFNRLFRISIKGGPAEPLPMPYGELATFSPDGKRMVFQVISREFRTWKRYRGGMASDLWLYDFTRNWSEKITKFEGTDALPMWHNQTLYFLSDRGPNKKLNIWALNLTNHTFHQVTHFKKYDVKWPSIGPDAIVFENGGRLYLVTLPDEKVHPVSIKVTADLPRVRPKWKNLQKYITNYDISPHGKRAVFEARGEILTVPAKEGFTQNLTGTSGVAERYPTWSPDGKWIAYFSDATGEYELYIRPASGKGKPRRITHDGHAFRYNPVWSPDSKKLAFTDKAGRIFVVNLKDGKPVLVDKDDWTEVRHVAWSPDSRWLAYSKRADNLYGVLMVYNVETRKKYQLTSDFYSDSSPVFDPDGKYLVFYSSRLFRPVYSDLQSTWIYPNTTGIFIATLRKDLPSPLAPRNDEEKEEKPETKPDKKAGHNGKDRQKPAAAKKAKPVHIDVAGFETRVVKLPVEPGNTGRLAVVKDKILFLEFPPAGTPSQGPPSGTLKAFDLKKRKTQTIIKGIQDYRVSTDGKHILYQAGNTFGIIDLAPGKKIGDGKLNLKNLRAWIDPQQEWHQIFVEAWRIERDYFYDPGMHGLDWQAVRKRYEALLDYVVDRADLNYVIGEMIAELNSSHTYVGGGDIEQPERVPVALLGCDFELDREHGLFRFKKIYEGAPWDVDVRSPLREPGIDVQEGDYLLAVNGRRPDPNKEIWAAFQGLGDEPIRLTVNHQPSPAGARDILVKPLNPRQEQRLRYLAWVNANRLKVEKATGGRVGYIYVPDTSINGQTELVRQFIPQRTKEGLIIDERFNSGGQIPDRFIELMNRPLYNYWARRDFRSWQTPFVTHVGPKVMLINGWSGSGGDAFPYYFKKAGLGPLIGTRTWGGLIGISGNPRLIDGGFVTAPTFGLFNTDGKWDVEGYGVDPDIPVENPPHELARGRDLQLEKAIAVVLEELKKHPPRHIKKPPYPDKSK